MGKKKKKNHLLRYAKCLMAVAVVFVGAGFFFGGEGGVVFRTFLFLIYSGLFLQKKKKKRGAEISM